MDIEIKFISQVPIDMKMLGFSIVELCLNNNWTLEISNKWRNDIISNEYEFEITTTNTLLVASIVNDSYHNTWLIESENDYHKKHLGLDCFYIMKVSYLKNENDNIDFLLDFSIKFLEMYPDVVVETLETDNSTGMKEYTLKELNQVRDNHFQNNWSLIKK